MAKRQHIPANEFMSGFNTVVDALNAKIEGMERQSVIGLKRAASRVIADAKQMAPLDKGPLRASGRIKEPIFVEDHVSVELGFYEPYAAEQHEHTEYHHEQGEAKYLEKAIIRNQDKILQLIAEGMLK